MQNRLNSIEFATVFLDNELRKKLDLSNSFAFQGFQRHS